MNQYEFIVDGFFSPTIFAAYTIGEARAMWKREFKQKRVPVGAKIRKI